MTSQYESYVLEFSTPYECENWQIASQATFYKKLSKQKIFSHAKLREGEGVEKGGRKRLFILGTGRCLKLLICLQVLNENLFQAFIKGNVKESGENNQNEDMEMWLTVSRELKKYVSSRWGRVDIPEFWKNHIWNNISIR